MFPLAVLPLGGSVRHRSLHVPCGAGDYLQWLGAGAPLGEGLSWQGQHRAVGRDLVGTLEVQ